MTNKPNNKEEELPVNEELDNSDIEETSRKSSEIISLPLVNDWCSTGCTVLDLAIADHLPGGIPLGRIIHVFGGGSTAKTVLGTTILGYAQRSGKMAYFADVEHTLDPNFARYYGLDCNDPKTFEVGYPETLEQMFDNYIGGIIYPNGPKKKINTKPKVIVVDSVTALPTEVELKEAMSEGSFSLTRPKQMSKGFRKYIFPMATSNTTLFCIDQTRDNVGVMFGKKEIVSGGRALEFYSSVQIHLKHDTNIINNKKATIGIWIKFEIVKNKVAPPFRKGRFKILFNYGLDDIASSLWFIAADQSGEKAASEKSTKIKIFGEEMTTQQWIKKIEEENLEAELKEEIVKLWADHYRTEQRKERVW